jgi:hypothetical protein
MNRLIAYRGNEPERLRAAFLAERSLLFPEAAEVDVPEAEQRGPTLRFGIGYYIGGEPQVQRFLATPAQGFASLRGLRADMVVAQVAAQTAASIPPYRYGPYLLGLHGEVPRLDVQQSELTQALPTFLHHNLRDHSPGERLLHLVCGRLHEVAPEYLADRGLAPEVAVAALAFVLQAVVGPAPVAAFVAKGDGGAALAPTPSPTLTMTMTNGEWLVIAQRGGPTIWYKPLAGVVDGEQPRDSYRGVWAMGHAGIDRMMAAERGFKQIPRDHALVITSDVLFQILPLS